MNPLDDQNVQLTIIVVVGIAIAIASTLLQNRAMKKRINKDKVYAHDVEIENQIRKDLPKFWTPRVIFGIILGLAIMATGIQYFWNTPGITPKESLWEGFAVVMGGVIVSVVSAASRFLPIAKEIDRRRRDAYGETT